MSHFKEAESCASGCALLVSQWIAANISDTCLCSAKNLFHANIFDRSHSLEGRFVRETAHSCLDTNSGTGVVVSALKMSAMSIQSGSKERETLNSSNSLISKASCPTTLIKHWSKSLATLPPAARSSSSKMEKIVSMKPCTVTMVLKSKFKRDHSPATKFHGRWWEPSQNQKAKDVARCYVLLELV